MREIISCQTFIFILGTEGSNMFSMTSLQISRNDYSLSDDESSVGTLRDFMLGIVVGYFLGDY